MRRVVGTIGGLLIAVLGSPIPVEAAAEPPPPCGYVLTPPERLSEAPGEVIATVAPANCAFPGRPGYGVACLQRQGGTAGMQCAQGRGDDAARVTAPFEPGATYVSTGRGCAAWAGIEGVAPLCQLLGPLTAAP